MRFVFALASIASLSGVAQAQFEGWEPGPGTPGVAAIPAAWTSVNASVGGPGTNPNWQVRNDGVVFPALTGSTYAFANYNSSTGANDISNYLMSPQVTISNGAQISFWTRTVSAPAFADRLELVFNTTGSTLPADFTNVLVTVNPTLTTAGYPTTWTQFTATITGVTGSPTGRYAFHYNPTNGGPLGSNSDYVGIDDVQFTPAGGGVLATNTALGTGCGATFNSFYELFPNAALASAALTGNALILTPTGNGYLGIWAPGAAAGLYNTPAGTTNLTTGDDGTVTVTAAPALPTPYGPQSTLQVSGNGIVGFGGVLDFPGTNSYTPTSAGFLNSSTGGIYAWHDHNEAEAGSGLVTSHQVGSVLYLTWANVESYPGGVVNQSTIQFQLDLSTGGITICFVNVDSNTTSTFGSATLVGVTAPGTSLDSGSINLATAPASAMLTSADVAALALAGSTRPIIGTSWNLDATNIPASVNLGIDLFGVSDPGITDLSLFGLGQSGCQLRASLDVLNAWLPAGSTHSYSFAIPNLPSALSLIVYTQSAGLQFPNLDLTLTTNGVAGLVGDF